MPAHPETVVIEVHCLNLPATCGGHRIFLGVQKERAVENIVPGGAREARFTLGFRLSDADGTPNFLGPYAQGPKHERFFYLSWGTRASGPDFGMFRRLKVHLSQLTWRDIAAAAKAGQPLRVALEMTDARGEPRCASVRAGQVGVDWNPHRA